MSLQANELRQMSSELMNCQSHAWQTSSELMVPRGSMANKLTWQTSSELASSELVNSRAGEYQPHADCPTEAGTYRKVLTLPPADKNAMIMGKKVQLT